ncbi:MFS transporter [Halovibrio salipaludis]|uniref:MFS transporter n=1 Tax=Halovibrio salipaludis TaxID=2032626 RepID=A0A2A2EXB0_9GAMM|nr:MFS transporter [Halovibrio salipaludis]PAU77796.1 MFS transporter [Halovibrio salipaludis]
MILGSSKTTFLAIALVFAVIMMGTTLPTPLYPLYQQKLGFSQLMITVIFATYAVGVIVALLSVGTWSDQLGRRPLLGVGLALSAASAVLFLVGGSVGPLLLGRLLSGLSAGIFTGTATVTVVELAPRAWLSKATFVATAANMGGLGLGPLVAGGLSQYLPAPLHLCFILDLVLLALGGAVVWCAPETVTQPAGQRLRVQVPRVPAEVRGVFLPAAIAGFAGFAVLGLFTAVAPAVMGNILEITNRATAGAVVFVVFIASTAGQGGQQRLPETWRLPVGCLLLVVGVALIGAAIGLASLTALLAGAVIAGLGQGVTLRAGLGAVAAASPSHRRGEVLSTFFVVLYLALSVPVIGIGIAADTLGLRTAGLIFTVAVATLGLTALGSLLIQRRSKDSATESTVVSD